MIIEQGTEGERAMIKVVKFGGSSLADAEQFRKVRTIIESDPSRAYVVPSAPGRRYPGDTKVTDLLIEAYERAARQADITDVMGRIRERYNNIAEELGLTTDLEEDLRSIAESLQAEPSRDYAASRGEYLNGRLLAEYLGYGFVDPYDVIMFREDGTADMEETERLMDARLTGMSAAVIPGFYGRGADGNVRTFSRGGSDVTGSIVAAAIGADVYENWTDVSGFMAADPGVVDDPVGIHTITYSELRELSYMGASVLHEDAIFPIRSRGIPINIRNTNRPDDEGSWIVESTARRSEYTITGIAGSKGFCAVLITKAMMNSEVGFCRKVLQVFEECGIPIEHMPTGIDTLTVVVDEAAFLAREQQIISGIHRVVDPDTIEIEAGLGLIAVVGRDIRYRNDTAARIFDSLADEDINIRMIDQGSSQLNVIIAVDEGDFEKATRCIYKAFVG